jgi:hypothetical protein
MPTGAQVVSAIGQDKIAKELMAAPKDLVWLQFVSTFATHVQCQKVQIIDLFGDGLLTDWLHALHTGSTQESI